MFIYVQGVEDAFSCPIKIGGAENIGAVSFADDVASCSIDLNVSGQGSANLSLVIPRHSSKQYFKLGRPAFKPMMEVEIYMKGRFLDEQRRPLYYKVFWGLITDVNVDYSNGQHNMSLTCADILYLWEITRVNTNPSAYNMNYNGDAAQTHQTSIFHGMNPFQIIIALARVTMGELIPPKNIGGWSGEKKQAFSRGIFGEENMAMMDYWANRFSSIGERLLLFGTASGNPSDKENVGTLKYYTQEEISNLTADAAAQLKPAGINKKFVPEQKAKESKDTRQLTGRMTYSAQSSITLDGSLFDQYYPFDKANQVSDFTSGEDENRKNIADQVKEFIGYEFFMDVTGEIVFKPPFYNLDVREHDPISIIRDDDILGFDVGEHAREIITRLSVKGAYNLVYESGDDNTIPFGAYIDYRLAREFGLRSTTLTRSFLYTNNLCNLFAISELSRQNARRYAGTITILGRPELRIGFPVYVEAMDTFYYVVGISHNYNPTGRMETTLQVEGARKKYLPKYNVQAGKPTKSNTYRRKPAPSSAAGLGHNSVNGQSNAADRGIVAGSTTSGPTFGVFEGNVKTTKAGSHKKSTVDLTGVGAEFNVDPRKVDPAHTTIDTEVSTNPETGEEVEQISSKSKVDIDPRTGKLVLNPRDPKKLGETTVNFSATYANEPIETITKVKTKEGSSWDLSDPYRPRLKGVANVVLIMDVPRTIEASEKLVKQGVIKNKSELGKYHSNVEAGKFRKDPELTGSVAQQQKYSAEINKKLNALNLSASDKAKIGGENITKSQKDGDTVMFVPNHLKHDKMDNKLAEISQGLLGIEFQTYGRPMEVIQKGVFAADLFRIPVSDEYGYELIGGFGYGRGAKLSATGRLESVFTPLDFGAKFFPNTANSSNDQITLYSNASNRTKYTPKAASSIRPLTKGNVEKLKKERAAAKAAKESSGVTPSQFLTRLTGESNLKVPDYGQTLDANRRDYVSNVFGKDEAKGFRSTGPAKVLSQLGSTESINSSRFDECKKAETYGAILYDTYYQYFGATQDPDPLGKLIGLSPSGLKGINPPENNTKKDSTVSRDPNVTGSANRGDLSSIPTLGVPRNAIKSEGIVRIKVAGDPRRAQLAKMKVPPTSKWASPVAASIRVSSKFSHARTLDGVTKPHTGTDYGTPMYTPVKATATGYVINAGWQSTKFRTGRDAGYGKMVVILHAGGRSSLYGHLSKVSVQVGDLVKVGKVIGLSGNTGHSTAPHLHFEIREDYGGYVMNARTFLSGPALTQTNP
jgi:murein DD-endopeptidase MepM/ murein hydrolase activator NlpD